MKQKLLKAHPHTIDLIAKVEKKVLAMRIKFLPHILDLQ